MTADANIEIKVVILSGLAEALASVKMRHEKAGEADEENGKGKGLIGKLITGGCYRRCAISEGKLPKEDLSEIREQVELVCFQKQLTSDEVVRLATAKGKRFASPGHIFAIGFLFPDEQEAAPMVFLDPTGAIEPIVLSSSCYGRSVSNGYYDGPGWPAHTRFVVFDENGA